MLGQSTKIQNKKRPKCY